MARRPSITRTGKVAKAAIASAQGTWKTALIPKPTSVIAAKYAQVADCIESAARARLSVDRAVLPFSQAKTGITRSAAAVMTLPVQLVSGIVPLTREAMDMVATAAARANSRTPAQRAARSLESEDEQSPSQPSYQSREEPYGNTDFNWSIRLPFHLRPSLWDSMDYLALYGGRARSISCPVCMRTSTFCFGES